MEPHELLAVTNGQALRFFFERLKDLNEDDDVPERELLYNASILAHFASTSTASDAQFPSCPTSLVTIFNLFVLDRSHHADPEILEAAGSQCLLLTGFFYDQLKERHNVRWYAALGAAFFDQAAHQGTDRSRSHMMEIMAARFDYWRRRQVRLARELRDLPKLISIH